MISMCHLDCCSCGLIVGEVFLKATGVFISATKELNFHPPQSNLYDPPLLGFVCSGRISLLHKDEKTVTEESGG